MSDVVLITCESRVRACVVDRSSDVTSRQAKRGRCLPVRAGLHHLIHYPSSYDVERIRLVSPLTIQSTFVSTLDSR